VLTILFYEREAEFPTTRTALDDALTALPGITWEAPADSSYRPGRWRDTATGARALWDVGMPPLEEDDQPARTYSGWRAVPLALNVPLVGPHWQAVTALAQVDRLLQAAPHLVPLNTEDTVADSDAEPGPYPWDRPRVIANWEKQCADRQVGLQVPRLARGASVALWRYRALRADGRIQHPEHHWPEGLVLLDREAEAPAVRSACLWSDPTEPFALPPVDLVVLRRGTETGVIPADELRLLTTAPALAGARLLEPSAAVNAFHAGAKTQPIGRFLGLGDEEWGD
jgi:hypothetical protein